MKYVFLFLFFSLSLPAAETHWFKTAPREVRALLADPKESQVRVGYLRTKGNGYFDIALGGHVGLYQEVEGENSFSISPRGVVTSRFQFGSRSFDLLAADYSGGVAFSWKRSRKAFEFLIQHTSSHLGDGAHLAGRQPFNYSLESIRALYSTEDLEDWRFYGGAEMIFRSDPVVLRFKPVFIGGAEWLFLGKNLPLCLAADLRLKGTHQYSLTSSMALSYEIGAQLLQKRQRFFIEVLNGHSPFGQFYEERETYLFAGFGFTL